MILYRMYDNAGTLIYVGITHNMTMRRSQHRRRHWFPEVCWTHTESFETESDARNAERIAIELENPRENIQFSPHRQSSIQINFDKLNKLRKDYRITKDSQLAELTGMNPSMVSRLLSGKHEPSAGTMASLTSAFIGVTLSELFMVSVIDVPHGTEAA